jgi:hypothetical protein
LYAATTLSIAAGGTVVSSGNPTAHPAPIAGGTYEASAVVHVKGTEGVLFVDDDSTREVFWMEITSEGMQKGPAVPVKLDAEIVDLEGLTTDGTHYYAVGSQSKNHGFDGDGLIRFKFDAARQVAYAIERVRGLKAFLAANVQELKGAARRSGDRVLNIEAIAWDHLAHQILLGLRAPVIAGRALIVPLKLRDVSEPLSSMNLQVPGKRAIRVSLEGAGVRSLEYDDNSGAFRMITGAASNHETRDFRILEWSGPAAPDRFREVTRFSRGLKPEGVTRADLHGRPVSVFVFDTGGYLVTD